jgi:hypothetical protein
MTYNRYRLVYKKDGIPTIENCYCRTLSYNTEGKLLTCEERKCGLSFEQAKEELLKEINSHIDKINKSKSYKEYEFLIR